MIMHDSLVNALIQIVTLATIAYGIYLVRARNDATQDELGLQAIKEKLSKYDTLENALETLTKDSEAQKKRFESEVTNNQALSRTIEDQSRRITVLTSELEKTNSRLVNFENDNRTLREDNLSKAMTISILQNERDIAKARLEAVELVLGKINITISAIEVIKSNES